ncbi:hypothetical protein NXS19_001701 [Fusarium pseudograminearum]|nr:hypothetical protein NXS19_001701 [Fusarium pseudograminearum]
MQCSLSATIITQLILVHITGEQNLQNDNKMVLILLNSVIPHDVVYTVWQLKHLSHADTTQCRSKDSGADLYRLTHTSKLVVVKSASMISKEFAPVDDQWNL